MNHHLTNSANVESRRVTRATPTEVNAVRERCLLLDVRTPIEFAGARMEGAVLRPMGSVEPEEVEALAKGREVVLICEGGVRAERVAAVLTGRVGVPITVLDGGLKAWQAAGLPTLRGERRGLPLERQVFIAAGSLILTGVTLGALVHSWFYALAGFVGAGLVFAGLTGTCGMGVLLAKMPWNRNVAACNLLKEEK